MLLVISVSRSDKQLIPNVEKALELFPPGNGHSLLIVGSPNVSSEMDELRGQISSYFTRDDVHLLDHDSFLGWPGACNYAFQQTCFHLREQGPWLWFELDCTPIKENWLSTIEEAYRLGPTRFMGCLERTYRGFNGELLSEEEGGKHMAACGVYPPYAADTIVPLKGVSETDIPWWSFLQWYIAPFCSHTDLIQNNYKTQNYREQLVTGYNDFPDPIPDHVDIDCDSCNNTAWDNHYNNPISPNAVLVHGCKDGSLIKLMLNGAASPDHESKPGGVSENGGSTPPGANKEAKPTLATLAQQNDKEEDKEVQEGEEQKGRDPGAEEKKEQGKASPAPKSYRKRGRKRQKVRELVPVLTDE